MEIRDLLDLIYDERENYYVVIARRGKELTLQNALIHFSRCDLLFAKDGKVVISDTGIEVKKAIDVLEYRMKLNQNSNKYSLADVEKEYDIVFTTEYSK